MKKIVLTGGPGIGKTTIINLLAEQGYQTLDEVARGIKEEQKAINGDLLPEKDFAGFQQAIVYRQIELESELQGTVYQDRGVIDNVAYCHIAGIEPPKEILAHADSYHQIFILDKLPDLKNDENRAETPEEQQAIQEKMLEVYKQFGYDPISVPVLEPQERLDFIVQNTV